MKSAREYVTVFLFQSPPVLNVSLGNAMTKRCYQMCLCKQKRVIAYDVTYIRGTASAKAPKTIEFEIAQSLPISTMNTFQTCQSLAST